MGGQRRSADERAEGVLETTAEQARRAGEQLESLLELTRLVHRARRARRADAGPRPEVDRSS